jgi:hypothetical protein
MKKNDPFTKEADTRFTLRIPTDLLELIKAEAEKNKRSTGKQIEFMLEQWYENVSEK